MTPHTDSESQTLELADAVSEDGLSPSPAPSHRLTKYTRPLIEYIRNEWQTNPKYTSLAAPQDHTDSPKWQQVLQSVVTAPRFRRYVLVYFTLLVTCFLGWKFVLYPRIEEHRNLLQSLDPSRKDKVGGWFGTNALPRFEDLVQLRTLDPALLPAAVGVAESGQPVQRRLVFIGDVHGCRTELERLLQEVAFNPETDHLIFTGDMINKGPDSLGVVDLARQYSASCVRGNHEDKVLLLRHEMIATNTLVDASQGDAADERFLEQDSRERTLARQLSDEQAKWLETCPVILNVGEITDMGRVVVAHAGLVPGVELEHQDPFNSMNMLTIDMKTHVPSSSRKTGIKWTKMFNQHESLNYSSLKSDPDAKANFTTVVYGHDAKNGLSLKKYTKGLDSGCVKGGKLTAMVVEDGGKQSIVQVKCKGYVKSKK